MKIPPFLIDSATFLNSLLIPVSPQLRWIHLVIERQRIVSNFSEEERSWM